MLLRGGRRVSEIGVLYPFEGLAGWFRFDNPDSIRQGFYISPETDYQTISGWLTNDIRRDFTFVHPELFLDDKYTIEQGLLTLDNQENYQAYHTMIMTGCNIISEKTLQKLQSFYDSGGTVIATSQLPFKSTKIGADQAIINIIRDMFGINPLQQGSQTQIVESGNQAGGKAIFVPNPDIDKLATVLKKYTSPPDVRFIENPVLSTDIGKFNYIHKFKDRRHIYFFTNSSDEAIETKVVLRGKLDLSSWNPHDGEISMLKNVSYSKENQQMLTRCSLKLAPVSSTFWVGHTP